MPIHRPIQAEDPALSVVIPTIPANSHEEVVKCLADQTVADFEVLVVDDAELDICEARNAGIERASTPVVALTDDDCEPPESWVEAIESAFMAEDSLVLLEGPIRGGRTYDGTRKYVGCNLAFDREAVQSVGGFRSDYAGWRDDTEFGWRVERDVEGTCRYDERMLMRHPDRTRADVDAKTEKRLQAEYPQRYEEIIEPDGVLARVNDWLWRRGFWDAVDRIRYG